MQLFQLDNFICRIILILHITNQLKPFLDILLVDEFILLQNLFYFWNSKNLLLECTNTGLGGGFLHVELCVGLLGCVLD